MVLGDGDSTLERKHSMVCYTSQKMMLTLRLFKIQEKLSALNGIFVCCIFLFACFNPEQSTGENAEKGKEGKNYLNEC